MRKPACRNESVERYNGMRNPITKSPNKLLPQIAEAIPGVTLHRVDLGLPEGFPALMETKRAALQLAQNNYLQGRTALKESQAAKRVVLDSAKAFITLARELARPKIGKKFGQEWQAYGFASSLRVPGSFDPLSATLGTMGGHLEVRPELGSEEQNITSEQAGVLLGNLTAAQAAVNAKKSEVGQLHAVRTQKVDEVYYLVREVLNLARLKFSPLDPRWSDLGFNKPGAQPVPPVPEGVTAVLIGTNAISVKWLPTQRAEYHRVWKRVIGIDEKLLPAGVSSDGDFLIEGLPGNSDVEVALSAGNNGGESATCPVIVVRTL